MKIMRCYFLLLLLPIQADLLAQSLDPQNSRGAVIKDVCKKLEKYYTFPDVGAAMSRTIQDNYKKGRYAPQVAIEEFLEKLNADLFNVGRDNHLKLLWDPEAAKDLKESGQEGAAVSDIESERWRNFGFKGLEVLDGNVGYLNLTDFGPVEYGGERAAAAMNYFADCRALIIDLRQNGGGNDDMVMFLASYFIDSHEPVVVKISYSTIENVYYSSTIQAYVPGKKFTDRPVYILTSAATASAAEAFITIMTHFRQDVTLVGQKTRGAENPVAHLAVGEGFVLRLPCWRQIYSLISTKWEGIGITPHFVTAADHALRKAHYDALKKLSGRSQNKDDLAKNQWAMDGIKPFLEPVSVEEEILKSYEGLYGNIDVRFENGVLRYGRDKQRLIPISETYFLVESADYLRVKFIVENGRVNSLERVFVYGYSTRHARK